MGVTAFPIISGAQITTGGDATAKHEPGTIMAYRSQTDQWATVEYVQLDNNGCDQGNALVTNHATLKQYSVKKSATGDHAGANFRGIALATIASQKFGFTAIGGYVEKAYVSGSAAASGEYLAISGSTAGYLTQILASAFNTATGKFYDNVSGGIAVAVTRSLLTSSAVLGSIQICGVWA